jgi:hypothetical protein
MPATFTRVINVSLHQDSQGNYSLNLHPLTTTVSVDTEEGDTVNIRWILVEDPENPASFLAHKLTVTFNITPTPFSGTPAPTVETYVAYRGPAGVVTSQVVDSSVGEGSDDVHLYKYNVTVETTDGKTVNLINLDPHIKVTRRTLTRKSL